MLKEEQRGAKGRLLKGFIDEDGVSRRWRLCFHPNKRWCIEFDEDAVVEGPERIEGDEQGRWLVRLSRDVEIIEIRSDTISDILKGCVPINCEGMDDEDGGEVGDPTSRGGPC